jgi:hypothetical protein
MALANQRSEPRRTRLANRLAAALTPPSDVARV